jgi:HEAT repeat protein
VRRGAAFALGKLGRNAALASPVLAARLKTDTDASVREAAAFAIGEIGSGGLNFEPKLTQILIEVMQKDLDALVRRSAVLALGSVAGKEPEVFEALGRACGDPSPAVRQNVAFVLGKLGPKAVETLRRTLTDDDPLVIRDSANALSLLRKDARPAVPQLVGCLGKPGLDLETRKAVVTTLVKLVEAKDKEAVDALSRVLKDPDVEVRINAALALGNIGGGEAGVAVPVLREALKQSDAAIRSQAAAALKNVGPQAAPAVPDLVAALSDKNEKVREVAAVALGSIGKDAEAAVPDLVNVMKKTDENYRVRAFAAVGLAMIGSCDAAVRAVPDIVNVMTDRKAPYPVRERALWAIRVHNTKLREMKSVLDGLEKLLSEPRSENANMLRYDAAYMLGMLLTEEAPAKTLDVLQDFLSDSSIRLYEGNTTQSGGGAKEGMSAEASSVQEKGTGDGRTMAIQALREIGRARVVQRQAIVKQLRAIATDGKVNKKLREDTQKLLAEFQLN